MGDGAGAWPRSGETIELDNRRGQGESRAEIRREHERNSGRGRVMTSGESVAVGPHLWFWSSTEVNGEDVMKWKGITERIVEQIAVEVPHAAGHPRPVAKVGEQAHRSAQDRQPKRIWQSTTTAVASKSFVVRWK